MARNPPQEGQMKRDLVDAAPSKYNLIPLSCLEMSKPVLAAARWQPISPRCADGIISREGCFNRRR